MGVVYRAMDRQTGEPVALKLTLATTDQKQRDERFDREIRLLAAIDHPRIARYVGHGISPDGRAFLAMQWLEGRDLGAVLAGGLLALADSLNVLAAAACLAFIDRLDVSPEDTVANGYARLYRAIFTFVAGNDLEVALALAEQAARDLRRLPCGAGGLVPRLDARRRRRAGGA